MFDKKANEKRTFLQLKRYVKFLFTTIQRINSIDFGQKI